MPFLITNHINLDAVGRSLVGRAIDLFCSSVNFEALLAAVSRFSLKTLTSYIQVQRDGVYFSDTASLYGLVDSDKKGLRSAIGFGMTYRMKLRARLAEYRDDNSTMKDQKYKMIEVLTLSSRDKIPDGLHFSLYIFIMEYALHCLKSLCNEEVFITEPGVGTSSGAIFLNEIAVRYTQENPEIMRQACILLTDALRKRQFVEEKVCPFYRHFS